MNGFANADARLPSQELLDAAGAGDELGTGT
jgi:hypothetical protein